MGRGVREHSRRCGPHPPVDRSTALSLDIARAPVHPSVAASFCNLPCIVDWPFDSTTTVQGHHLPWLIRNTMRKPIVVYLADGENDSHSQHGSLPNANAAMAAALDYAGYAHSMVFGQGGHSPKHMASLLPDALRWLFSTDPAPPPPAMLLAPPPQRRGTSGKL